MNASTWTVVTVFAVMAAFTFAVFFLSLVPGLPAKARAELASWPQQWAAIRADVADLWGDAVALVRRGRHAGTPQADIDPESWRVPQLPPVPPGPVDDDDNVRVISDNSVTQVLPVIPERTDAGATESWSPMDELERIEASERYVQGARAARTAPDPEALAILAGWDEYVNGWNAVPKYLAEWGKAVDDRLAAVGLNADGHKRWRATAFDVPTGEYRLTLAGQKI